MIDSKKLLLEIKARANAATPVKDWWNWLVRQTSSARDQEQMDQRCADSAFIRGARQDIPYLLDVVEELTAENERLKAWRKGILAERDAAMELADERLAELASESRWAQQYKDERDVLVKALEEIRGGDDISAHNIASEALAKVKLK